ncbi:DUF4097 domain-containing protein [Patescibacteria group bacterium]|nr:DUF4097 domain-containing protein [Patescibacteria group bacterium]
MLKQGIGNLVLYGSTGNTLAALREDGSLEVQSISSASGTAALAPNGVTTVNGDFSTTNGDFTSTNGEVTVSGNITAQTGRIEATMGDVTANRKVEGGYVHGLAAIVGEGTYTPLGGAYTPTTADFVGGFVYHGAAGGAVALNLPDIADVQTALAAATITTIRGTILPLSAVVVTDANNLTITAGLGGAMLGNAVVNNRTAFIMTMFTNTNTAVHIVV